MNCLSYPPTHSQDFRKSNVVITVDMADEYALQFSEEPINAVRTSWVVTK